jgi:predicted nucleic acid-binding protein
VLNWKNKVGKQSRVKAVSRKRFAAVDTRFLIALHAGDENCQGVVDWLSANNVFVCITSCVIQELVDMVNQHDEESEDAREVLQCIPIWGFLPTPQLEATNNGIVFIIAQKMMDKGVVKTEDLNDCVALVEAAFEDCVLFVTTRESLIQASYDHLRLALIESDVTDVPVFSPADIMSFVNAPETTPDEAETISEAEPDPDI